MADQTVLTSRGRAKDALIGTPTSGPMAEDNPEPGLEGLCRGLSGCLRRERALPLALAVRRRLLCGDQGRFQAIDMVDGDLSDGQAKLHEALSTMTLETPLGTVKLNENRQASGSVFITEVVEDGAGGLKVELKSRVDDINQTLGMTADEFRAMGLPSRDTPDCTALGGKG
jgi:branched-chain amino acid transport system substrate-binding protein